MLSIHLRTSFPERGAHAFEWVPFWKVFAQGTFDTSLIEYDASRGWLGDAAPERKWARLFIQPNIQQSPKVESETAKSRSNGDVFKHRRAGYDPNEPTRESTYECKGRVGDVLDGHNSFGGLLAAVSTLISSCINTDLKKKSAIFYRSKRNFQRRHMSL